MTIKVGDKLPDVKLYVMTEKGPQAVQTGDMLKGKKTALFALPGAYTPTCSAKHVPGFLDKFDQLKSKGVDQIVCLSVNDAFVMGAWGKDQKVGDKIVMAADPNAEFTKAVGLGTDIAVLGGLRSQRYSMIVEDGVVKKLNVEEPGAFEVSSADYMIGQL